MIDSIATIGLGLGADKGDLRQTAKTESAACDFEALLIGELLKSSREAGGGGWLGTGDDDAGCIGVEMAEQQFAQMLAKRGGLGLAALISQGLSRDADPAKVPAPDAAHTLPETGV